MRTIKFRAWDTETKEMSYDFLDKNWLRVSIESPYVELMQFTGLHDDTDDQNEVFEGDILEVSYEGEVITCQVKFEVGGFLLASDRFEDSYIWASDLVESDRNYHWITYSTKLGNIYENPELLDKP